MKKLLTASKFKNWLACKYTVINEFNRENLKIKEFSKTEDIRKKRGDEFEDKIYKKLIKKYKNYIKIENNSNKYNKTKEAINKGYDLIHKASFEYQGWQGEIDFLIKVKDAKTKNGKWKYEVFDTKLSSVVKTEHIIQICIYSEWLALQQDKEFPEFMYLILGNGKEEKYKTKDYRLYVQKHKESFVNFLKDEKLQKEIYPEKCSFCELCNWINICEKKWLDDDHLNQIAYIRRDQIKKINNHGIKTLKKFSELKSNEKIKNLPSNIFEKHLSQAKLVIKSKETGQPQINIFPQKEGRGFNKLPKKSATENDLFFDIEGLDKILNPEEVEGNKSGLEYLFGIYNYGNKPNPFKYFWAHNSEEEKDSFYKLLDFFDTHLKKFPDTHIYHFNHYEQTALTKLSQKYGKTDRVNSLLREGKLIDLHKVVTQGMQVSETEYSLKNLEKFYQFKRSGDIQKANESTDNYLEWLETKDEELLDKIKIYNEEDCRSTFHLREWLVREIRPQIKNVSWRIYEEPKERIKNWEDANKPLVELINKNLQNSKIKDITSDILGFHKREDDIYWQDFFRRATNKVDEDLIEDAKCIGNMQQIKSELNENYKKGQGLSYIHTYKFDNQDYKIKVNNNVLNALEDNFEENKIGKVTHIDDESEQNIIKIQSKSKELPQTLSIIVNSYVNSANIIGAIKRFAISAVDNNKKYKATHEILNKNFPKIKNIKQGENLIKDENFLEESLKAVENLNESYLYFQGPPGVGKTYTAAYIIIELLKKSKKIGITAQSHKIIFNLLHKIEEFADKEENFSFLGFHKPGTGDDKRFDGKKYIKNTGKIFKKIKNKKVAFDQMTEEFTKMNADLFSGTAWCFTSLNRLKEIACDQKLDYIFIDEAGQFSIADIVAVSLSAKNVVIIGDQMQLSSPITALHPGESGKSGPEYLLEGQDTITKDKGIFIDKTRRLHPSICEFISDNFYDSRLKNFEFTKKRKIIFPKKEQVLSESGIILIDANHKEISRQKSVDEGQLIKKLYDKIIGCKFVDPEKKIEKILTVEDILTVAPYNVQVNYLKSILPKNSKVGTIDIFQGQEAPVTIISMTTSDPESLPRSVNFFFSRNRLNVALSRSQCLSIVILNKKLLEISCKKVEHIKLVNTFMKLLDYEKTL